MRIHNQKGISLIELMVAITVSLLVINAAIITYINMKRSFINVDTNSDIIAKSLTVQLILDDALNNVGFVCPYGFENSHDVTNDGMYILYDGPISVGLVSQIPSGISLDYAQSGSNYLAIQKGNNYTTIATSNSSSITLADEIAGLQSGSYMITCSDRGVEMLKSTAVTNGINLTLARVPPHPRHIDSGDLISDYELNIYYVRDTLRTTAKGDVIYGLYNLIKTKHGGAASYELVEGITNFQIQAIKREDVVFGQSLPWGNMIDTKTVINSNYSALKLSYDVDGINYSRIIPV